MGKIKRRLKPLFLLVVFLTAFGALTCSEVFAATSSWVSMGSCHLQYKLDSNGNKIMDYSYAGYQGGGVAIPVVPVVMTVTPVSGDNTANIQNAVNSVAGMVLSGGFRGAVLLEPGTYNISGTVTISASGVVLRGSGSGSGGTVLNMTGTAPQLLLTVAGSGSWATTGSTASMTDAYVPSGVVSFNVSSTSGFAVGDTILVERPVTTAWVAYMGMNNIPSSSGTGTDTWIGTSGSIKTDRTITAINGNNVTLDVPLTDSFDSTYLTGNIIRYTFAGRISEVGIEDLSVVAPAADVSNLGTQFQALTMSAAIDSWVQNLALQDTENSVSLSATTKRVTFNNVGVTHTVNYTYSAGPEDFMMIGTQILMQNVSDKGNTGVWAFSTSSETTGPVVLLNCSADARGFEPHQRWATGLLADNCNFPGGTGPADQASIAYSNRGNYGSGQGWDAGWAVAWNVTGGNFLVQAPPGVDNWCIGCVGTEISSSMPGGSGNLANGIYESLGTHVSLGTYTSLYQAQLNDRLSGGCASPTSTFTKSPTATVTSTPSSTATLTRTSTVTSTYTNSSTATYTNSNTATLTFTASSTATRTFTATVSNTATNTFTKTFTSTSMNTASSTPTYTNSSTPTDTNSPTASFTASGTSTLTNTATNTWSSSPTFTRTFTTTATSTATSTQALATSTFTNSVTPTATATNTATITHSVSATATSSPTKTATLTWTTTTTPSYTFTSTPTATASSTNTRTLTPIIPTATYTSTPTFTHTAVPPTATSITSGCSGIPNWNGNFVAYSSGQKVDYNGEVYQCIQSHTSQPGWEPPVVPALWKDLGACGSKPTSALAANPVTYPNPATSASVNVQLPVLNAANVKVQIMTVSFREVQTINLTQVAGNDLVVLLLDKSGTPLANGLYYFVIQANGQKWVNKVLVLR